MASPASPSRSPDGLEREAARWAARVALGELTDARREALDEWLKAPGHKAAFDRMAAVLEIPHGSGPVLRAVDARAARREREARSLRKRTVAATLAAATIGLMIGVADPPALLADQRSGTAEVRRVVLEDGSTLWLDARSAVNLHFTADTRTIELVRGQIHVEASHEARPFVVKAAGGRAVDIGTAFTVRLVTGGAGVEVAEGLVEAEASGERLRLERGEAAEWRGGGPIRRPMADPDLSAAWRTGLIVVRDRPLAEVIRDLNRRRARPYLLTDASVGRRRVNGVVRVEALNESFAALAESQGLQLIDLGLVIWLTPLAEKPGTRLGA